MKYSSMNVEFNNKFPEFESSYKEFFSEYDIQLKYPFFEGVIAHILEVLLDIETNDNRDDLLKRLFAFIEDMMNSEDEDVVTLAFISFFEYREFYWLSKAAVFMSSNLRDMISREFTDWEWDYSNYPQSDRKYILPDCFHIRKDILNVINDDNISLKDIPLIKSR